MKAFRRIVPSSVTMSLDRQAKELAASGKDVINLTAGQVDLPMPDAAKEAVRTALEADRTGYGSGRRSFASDAVLYELSRDDSSFRRRSRTRRRRSRKPVYGVNGAS